MLIFCKRSCVNQLFALDVNINNLFVKDVCMNHLFSEDVSINNLFVKRD